MPKRPLHPGEVHQAVKKLASEYFERYPKDRYLTEVEAWSHLQSDNTEFIMKRLREPSDVDNHRQKSTG
jgi:hypothetical protein